MPRRASFLIAAAASAMAAGSAQAQDKPAPDKSVPAALFDLALDIDNDGKLDRAVLVSPKGKDAGFFESNKAWFMLGPDGRADLYIYLAAGDAPLNLSKPPSFVKTGIVDGERYNLVSPLESTGTSLRVKSAYSLYGDWKDETLTIVHRRGEFVVAGLTYGFELKDGTQGDCDIDFLTGKGTASKGLGGSKKPARGNFAPVKLAAWSAKNYPKACRF